MRVIDRKGSLVWPPDEFFGATGFTFLDSGRTYTLLSPIMVPKPGTYGIVCKTNLLSAQIAKKENGKIIEIAPYEKFSLETKPITISVK